MYENACVVWATLFSLSPFHCPLYSVQTLSVSDLHLQICLTSCSAVPNPWLGCTDHQFASNVTHIWHTQNDTIIKISPRGKSLISLPQKHRPVHLFGLLTASCSGLFWVCRMYFGNHWDQSFILASYNCAGNKLLLHVLWQLGL